jgi:hypothetical protein
MVAMIHESLSWMLGKEQGLSKDFTGRTSGRRRDGCSQAAMSGSGGDLSSGKSKFLRKRNPKEDGEWIRQWIMKLSAPFIGRRREG